MALAPGVRIGVFEVTGSLGAGGMGEVYRAKDTKLGRDVALKILPDQFATDPDRLARFGREAQVLASLNHPNVGAIYGFEESNGLRTLVLELVEGPTLAECIARGPIPVDKALSVAKQIAEALAAAHERGIIHRDLKPSNIKLRPDGMVKVLDFGLAKALISLDSADRSNLASASTQVGVVLGTAAYMSPEQAGGQPVDQRTDLWAFGCVLYEMLTGQRAFRGETFSDTIAAVVERDPDWNRLPFGTSSIVRSLLRQCLRKQPIARLHDARAARIALEDAVAAPELSASSAVNSTSRLSRRALSVFLFAMLAGAVVAWVAKPAPPIARPFTRVLLDVRPAERFVGSNASPRPSRTAFAVSPDGQTVVFSGVRGNVTMLFTRKLNEAEAKPLVGTEGALFPFLSPDGRWVGFQAAKQLKKVPIDGGPPIVISDLPANGMFGASWGSDDRIVFTTNGREISVVTAAGGMPIAITKSDATKSEPRYILPHSLPGGKAILYTSVTSAGDWDQTSVMIQSLETGERRTLFKGGADARYVSTGHLLYMKAGTMLAVPFDLPRLELNGAPVAILDDVMQAVASYNSNDETGAGQFAVSDSGTLVFLAGGIYPTPSIQLLWVGRNGVSTVVPMPVGTYLSPKISPDGKYLAYYARRGRSQQADIWVYSVDRQTATRLTFEGYNTAPVWAPDGQSLVFLTDVSGVSNIGHISADGSGVVKRLISSPYDQRPASWSAVHNVLAFLVNRDASNQIWLLPMSGEKKPKPFLQAPFSLSYPEFSPDGRWIAYVSAESGANEVYVQPYPGPGAKIRISADRGFAPVWSRSGRSLFYKRIANPGSTNPTVQMMVVDIDLSTGFRPSNPRVLFEGDYLYATPLRDYDVAPDGERFIMTKHMDPEPVFTQMHVILNWTEELKRLVPTN